MSSNLNIFSMILDGTLVEKDTERVRERLISRLMQSDDEGLFLDRCEAIVDAFLNELRIEEKERGDREFLTALTLLCREHGRSISHEDSQGGFLIHDWNQHDEDWLRQMIRDRDE